MSSALVTIGTTHNDKKLSLVAGSDKALNWATNPVTMTAAQFGAIKNQSAVIAVLQDSWKSPTAAAGIAPNKVVVPVLLALDRDFRAAKLEYQNSLAIAEGEDLKILRALEQSYTIKSYDGFFGFFYTVMEFFGASYKSETEAAKEGSSNRIAFMHEISTSESKRLKKVQDDIIKCIAPILADIKKKAVLDIELLKKLHQITAVFKALFPNVVNADIQAAEKELGALPKNVAGLLT